MGKACTKAVNDPNEGIPRPSKKSLGIRPGEMGRDPNEKAEKEPDNKHNEVEANPDKKDEGG